MPASEHDSVVAHIDSAAMIPTQTFTGSSQSKFWPGCVSGGVTAEVTAEGGRESHLDSHATVKGLSAL